jgi:tetratricopeptide (TPR) repeat protein
LARSYLEEESAAIIDFTSSLEINDQLVESYASRGVSLMQLGDSEAAIIDFNKAIELNPKDALVYFNRSKCKQALGDFIGCYDDCMIAYKQDNFNPSILEHKLFLETLKESDLWEILNSPRDNE